MSLTLEELAERLNPARYADLLKTERKPKATNGEMALFQAAVIKLVESSDPGGQRAARLLPRGVRPRSSTRRSPKPSACRRPCCGCAGSGRISYDAIIDEARNVIVPPMWNDGRDFLDSVIPQFRTDPWADARTLVLVFSEKMGMTPILREVTERYGVPLFPTIGYTSETFVWDAAQLAKRAGKPVVVLQVGDYDNSGLDMVRAAEEGCARWWRRCG